MERHPSLDERFDPAIRIVVHDPSWPSAATAEMRRIEAALGELVVRLEHIGSTAVVGLAAKPIIDLQLAVEDLDATERYAEPLQRLGYLFAFDPDSPQRRFFARPRERPRTHHLHVCAAGSATEFRHLAVRDYLRSHDEEAAAYATLKRNVAQRHPLDRLAYMNGKHQHVSALENRAVAWAKQQIRAPPRRVSSAHAKHLARAPASTAAGMPASATTSSRASTTAS